ncbi:divalent metal cation transporter [Natronomonas salina]|uniref:divalent metal cation transporter n=1 Tax=Natronomonas salina TaxID=1710540 RepID=UPI0015B57A49|nr:divalent metal cation transporter [Natronomonas salina]QLD89044.1 divalent metal cation transporter [Natronomonas salina]
MSNAQWTDGTYRRLQHVLESYGMGLLFAANIFGAGSIYILTSTGANFGFSLLWVLPASLLVGLAVHEMSIRMAVRDQPLMAFIRDGIGDRPAKGFALFIAFIMHFWSVANYALAGAALAYLTPLDNVLIWTVLAGAAGLALVELKVYHRIETVIAILVLAVFGSYLLLFFGVEVPVAAAAGGLVPTMNTDVGYLTMIIALVGTTIYYPNFFIQTSMYGDKPFETLGRYRRDHTFGLLAAILMSAAVLIIAAITVPTGESSLIDPARPLVAHAGQWALPVFVIAAGAASFSSATGTLFGAGFMVPQAFGLDTSFGDRPFRLVVEVLIALSVVLAVPILAFTDFTPVRLALLMPAVNGVVGLPATVVALYLATHEHYELSWFEDFSFVTAVALMIVAALVTTQSLGSTIVQWV